MVKSALKEMVAVADFLAVDPSTRDVVCATLTPINDLSDSTPATEGA